MKIKKVVVQMLRDGGPKFILRKDETINRGETNKTFHLVSFWLGKTVEKRRREKRRGRRGRRRGRITKRYESLNSCMQSCVFWMSRVFGMNLLWMISCTFPRVLLGDYPNPRFVEFMWVKP